MSALETVLGLQVKHREHVCERLCGERFSACCVFARCQLGALQCGLLGRQRGGSQGQQSEQQHPHVGCECSAVCSSIGHSCRMRLLGHLTLVPICVLVGGGGCFRCRPQVGSRLGGGHAPAEQLWVLSP